VFDNFLIYLYYSHDGLRDLISQCSHIVPDIIRNQFIEGSKMAARGRKQKACFLKRNLGEMLETQLAGKNTEKRQNFDPSTLPSSSENLHFT
jgi:hypothetical protein